MEVFQRFRKKERPLNISTIMIKRDNTWQWLRAWTIQVGDLMFGVNESTVEVTSISAVEDDWIDVAIINVEEVDNYFVHGVLVHNIK